MASRELDKYTTIVMVMSLTQATRYTALRKQCLLIFLLHKSFCTFLISITESNKIVIFFPVLTKFNKKNCFSTFCIIFTHQSIIHKYKSRWNSPNYLIMLKKQGLTERGQRKGSNFRTKVYWTWYRLNLLDSTSLLIII